MSGWLRGAQNQRGVQPLRYKQQRSYRLHPAKNPVKKCAVLGQRFSFGRLNNPVLAISGDLARPPQITGLGKVGLPRHNGDRNQQLGPGVERRRQLKIAVQLGDALAQRQRPLIHRTK